MDTNEPERSNDESPKTSRRTFLASAAGAAGAAGALFTSAAGAVGGLIAAPSAAITKGATAREILYLENTPMGFLSGRGGGLPFVEVQSVKTGLEPGKGIAGTVKYEPLILEFGAGMPTSLYEWISDSLQLKPTRKSGYLAFVGFDGNEGGRLTFTNALISEVTFPALDGANKDVAAMTIALQPEFTQLFLSPGTPVKHALPLGLKQKNWLSSNFRMAMDRIDLKGLMAVDAQSTRIRMSQGVAGQDKFPTSVPTGIENGTLVIAVREADSRQFLDWFNQLWGPNGNPNDPSLLRPATIDLMDPTLKNVMGSVRFNDLRVAKVAPETTGPSDAIRKVKVEFLVGSTTIEPKTFV